MANPTTNFGWVMPTSTDLVTDLPADFNVFGQGVDTSMQYLLGGTTGQVLSKTSATNMAFTWVSPNPGDITAVNVTSPITGGGTSGDVTIAIQDALTTQKGAVQLSDSTSTTSSVLAATPTAVKSAYDLANAAIAKSTVTTAGDIIYRNATVPTRLGIGTAGQVLKVNSGATAPEWGSAAVNQSYSLINAGGTALTAASTITVSGISGMNALKILVIDASTNTASDNLSFRFNADSGANYDFAGPQFSAPVAYAASSYSNFSTTAFTRIESGTMSNNAASKIGAYCEMTGCNSTGFKSFTYGGSATLGGGTVGCQTTWGGGIYKGTSTISSVTVFNTGGNNFDGGTIYIYGSA